MDNNKGYQIITTKNSYIIFAIVGFVLGIISFFLNLFGIVGILAVVFSAIGLSQISKKQKLGKILDALDIILAIAAIIFAILGIIFGAINIIYAIYAISLIF